MDLGSRICTPTTPKCEECPISQYCLAYAENRQTDFPVKSKKQSQKMSITSQAPSKIKDRFTRAAT